MSLSHERLVQVISYCEETGIFTWNVSRGPSRAGKEAGSRHCKGYRAIMIDGKMYLSHRLAWFYVHGKWPEGQIDHADGVVHNNAISNLRDCTAFENKQNLKTYTPKKGKSSIFPGVYFDKRSAKWHARISSQNKLTDLGHFEDEDCAYSAYLDAKARIHWFQPIPREIKP